MSTFNDRPRSRTFLVAGLRGNLLHLLSLRAGETTDGKSATARQQKRPREYKNWIELGIGGVITSGDKAQFEQQHWLPGDQPYGGIQDLHFEGSLGKDGLFSVDGHGIWDTNDYDIQTPIVEAEARLHQGRFYRISQLVRWERRILPAQ